ncbi:MAG: PD-(D/E)XK nuclease family protein [Clostridia bacterium]|nr:PD-(D/E)XK nuclease family protein [Clostridia bacterium]
MLHLVIGRIGCGKTQKIYSEIEKLIDLGEKDILLLVPEQYSFETEKNIVTKMGPLKADKVSVFSFTFLAKHLLKMFDSADMPEIDDSVRAVLMSLALEQVSDKLNLYSKSKYTQGFITEMMGMIKEFRQCAVSPDDLYNSCEEMSDGVLKSKVSELSLISRAYTALLQQSWFDDETSLDRLHSVIDKIDWFNGKTVFIDGFRGYTAQETVLLGDILPRAKDVYITVCTDKVSGLFEKHSVFAHTRRTARKLYSLNEKCSMPAVDVIEVEKSDYYTSSELAHLEKELYSIVPQKYENEVNDIEICRAENFLAECDYVASNVKRLISENGYRCRDIAVIGRNSSEYESGIKSALKKFDVPVFVDKRQPIMTQPLVNFVNAALKIASDGFSTENVMRLLKTGLTNLSQDDISALENYAVMWKINGSRWCEDFKGHPDGLGCELLEKHAEILEKINRSRKTVTYPLSKFRTEFKNINGRSAAQAVYDLLVDFNVSENLKKTAVELKENGEIELALEQERIWDILIEILDDTATVLKNTTLTAKRFEELFNTMVSRFTMGALPSGLDEVLIGSAERVLTSSPKVIFAVGVNDGVFPYVQLNKKVLSRNEREQLKLFGIDLGQEAEEDVTEERFISYKTLCGATDKLYLSYCAKNLSGAELAPSELISQIKKIFPDVKTVDTALIEKTELLRSKKASFEVMAKGWRNPDSVVATLKEYFKNDSASKDRLKALKRAADKKEFSIEDKAVAQKLFGRDMYMSATRVETYFKCPFEYFCKYGIQAKPAKVAELDPMQKGTIIHYVLENIIKAYGSEALCKMSDEKIDKIVLELLENYFKMNMSAGEEHSERFNYLYMSLGKTVCAVAKRLIKEFSVSDFVPVDFELPIDNDSEVKPLVIELSDGGSLKLKGSVDRVDMMTLDDKKFVRVVDYKSGGKNFQLSDVFYGLNMQMLIYLFAIWKNGTGKYENISPAGILYMPVKATVTDLGRDATDEEILNQQMKDCRMNGMVLDDSRVIIGMDNNKSGMFIPVKYDEKKCAFSGSLIGFKEMSLLSDKVEDILREMGDCLHNGKIKAEPVFSASSTSAYTDACKYCDYKTVCGFEPDDQRKEIEKLSDADCFKLLLSEDGEENATMD